MLPPPAEKLQNFFGVFLQFQIGVDTFLLDGRRPACVVILALHRLYPLPLLSLFLRIAIDDVGSFYGECLVTIMR